MALSQLEGVGLYSQTDAARYSEIPLSTVHRWLARRYRVRLIRTLEGRYDDKWPRYFFLRAKG